MDFAMIGLLLIEVLDRLRVRLNMYLVCSTVTRGNGRVLSGDTSD